MFNSKLTEKRNIGCSRVSQELADAQALEMDKAGCTEYTKWLG